MANENMTLLPPPAIALSYEERNFLAWALLVLRNERVLKAADWDLSVVLENKLHGKERA